MALELGPGSRGAARATKRGLIRAITRASTAMIAESTARRSPRRHGPVALCPAGGLALDALTLGGVAPGMAGPQCIGSGAKLNQTTSVRTWAWVVTCTATRRQSESISSYSAEGCPRDHHLARQAPEQSEKGRVVSIGILVAVPPVRPAGRMQIRWVAVDQFGTPEREAGQELVRTAMHQFHRVLAPEPVKRALIAVNPDAAHRRGLAGHQRTAHRDVFRYTHRAEAAAPGAPDTARSWPWIRSTPIGGTRRRR